MSHRDYCNQKPALARTGFTLIEILIVIAILSILAAILFPVFSRARENARRTSCLSNMNQIGLAMLMYAQDYDERYYGATGNPGNIFPGIGWAGATFPYIKGAAIFKCPSDSNLGSGANVALSYAFNYYAASTVMASHQYPAVGVLFSEISGPSVNVTDTLEAGSSVRSPIDNGHILIWVEGSPGSMKCCKQGAAVYHTRGIGVLDHGVRLDDANEFGPQPTQGRHLEGANYTFLDGHSKWIKADAVRSFNYSYGAVPPGHAYITASDPSGAAYYSAE